MAWTVTRYGSVINIIPGAGNTADFEYDTAFPEQPEGLKIVEIQIVFSAANDKLVIRNGSLTGPEMFNYTTLDGSSVAKKFHSGLLRPHLVHADQVYSTPANWRIIIQTT